MATSANQKIFDAAMRHQVYLLRFSAGEAERLLELIAGTEEELLAKILGALAAGRDARRLEALLVSIHERRAETYQAASGQLTESLAALAASEAQWEAETIQAALPIDLHLASVPMEVLRGVVASPITGLPLKGWMDNIAAAEATALQRAVSTAMTQGETIDQVTRRIRGTARLNYEDGIMTVSRRNAQALARTAVNHVSNGAREQMWEANADLMRAKRWTSTLDGRTSSICQARDGAMAPIGGKALLPGEHPLDPPGARPPAHFNCRSVLVAVLDGLELAGDRPFVADERTRADRERDFRAEAKQRGVPLGQVREEWADRHVGSVPATTNYNDWMKRQPASFQDQVLGPARAELFRSGTTLDRFVDHSGRRYTLEELRSAG